MSGHLEATSPSNIIISGTVDVTKFQIQDISSAVEVFCRSHLEEANYKAVAVTGEKKTFLSLFPLQRKSAFLFFELHVWKEREFSRIILCPSQADVSYPRYSVLTQLEKNCLSNSHYSSRCDVKPPGTIFSSGKTLNCCNKMPDRVPQALERSDVHQMHKAVHTD